MLNKLLLLIFIILQVLDIYTTLEALKKPGNQEGNKLLKWLMDKTYPFVALAGIKLVVSLAMVWATVCTDFDWWTYVLIAVNLFYIWVVGSNSKRL